MAKNKHVDLAYLQSISMGDNTLIVEMIDLFLEKVPEMLANIERFCEEGLWDEMAAEIHRLKPNLDYVGMDTTKELIEEIETDARNKENIETFDARVKEVKARCLRAYDFLKEERANLK